MTSTSTTPRIDLLESLIAADRELDRLHGRLRELSRRRFHQAVPAACTPLEAAYLRQAEDRYDVAVGQLHAARREAQALVAAPSGPSCSMAYSAPRASERPDTLAP